MMILFRTVPSLSSTKAHVDPDEEGRKGGRPAPFTGTSCPADKGQAQGPRLRVKEVAPSFVARPPGMDRPSVVCGPSPG